MREKDLPIDRTCHVVYSKGCKAQIQGAIACHYPEGEREAVWEAVQRKYVDCLSQWRTDLGGSKNFHNGPGGTYDCAALMCYYAVCREVTSLAEIEAMEGELFLPAFRRLRFVDVNRPFWRRLLYRAFAASKKKCDRWHDYEMHVRPQAAGEPIYYEFTACPTADFAKKFGLHGLPSSAVAAVAGLVHILRMLLNHRCQGAKHFFHALDILRLGIIPSLNGINYTLNICIHTKSPRQL